MQEELNKLEAELRSIPPAAAPPDFVARLRAATATAATPAAVSRPRTLRWADWLAGWRALVTATPVAALLLIWFALRPAVGPASAEAADAHGIKANTVQVDHSLVASFDAVAQMPDGEPVRFHCRKWQDNVVVHDDTNGVFITQSTPRLEVVPVRFETY